MRVNLKQLGFTMIEILIVIALFGVLASFAVPSFQKMINNTKIRTATDSILSGLQLARAEAVKRNVNVQFEFRGAGNPTEWTVCLSPAGGGACPAVDGATTVQSRRASEGSSSDVTANPDQPGPYVFNGYGLMSSPGALAIAIDNPVMPAADSRDLMVVIGAGGAVNSCDPALDTTGTDPRRC